MMTPDEMKRRAAFMQFAADYAAKTMVACKCGGEKPLAEISGSVIYTHYDTLRRGDVYFLGANPAGNPEWSCAESKVGYYLQAPEERLTYNQFWEGKWIEDKPGMSPLQRKTRHFLCALSDCNCSGELENPNCAGRRIFASNMVFPRSSDWNRLSDFYDTRELVEKCWPIHKRIINDVVRPKLIVIASSRAYPHLKAKLASDAKEEIVDAKHGNWKCHAFETTLTCGKTVRVVQIPHLSRYALDKPKRDKVREWIKSKLD